MMHSENRQSDSGLGRSFVAAENEAGTEKDF